MKYNLKKTWTILLITLMSLIIFQGKVFAKDIKIDVTSELEAKGKIGYTMPIEIRVEAINDDIDGTLNLFVGEDKYEHSIKISSGSSKNYIFLTPIKNPVKDIKVSIVENNKILNEEEFPIKIYESNYPFIGVLSSNVDNYRFFKDIKIESLDISGGEIIDLKKAELNYAILQNMNFIIIDDFNSESLNENSKENLDKWLKDGGMIFLGKGKYKYKNLKGPFENVDDTTSVGNGIILPVEFELSEKNNMNKFNEKLLKNMNYRTLNTLVEKVNIKEQGKSMEKLNNSAHSMLKVNKNIIYFSMCLLIVYLVSLIAVVLFEKGKIYIWITILILFSVMTFAIYSIEGAGSQKITMASLNQYFYDFYKSNSIVNIYPCKKNVELTLNNSLRAFQQGTGEYSLDTVSNKILYKKANEINYMYNLAIDTIDKKTGNKLTLENGRIKGEIKNELLYKLKDSFLIIGDTFIKVGDIESGESVKIDYLLDQGLMGKGDFEYINLLQKELLNKYEKEFIKHYITLKDSQEFNCNLIGFTKRKTPLIVNESLRKINSMNMEILPVSIDLPLKKMEIPEGLIKPIIKFDMEAENIREYIFKKDEAIKIYYNLPKNMNIEEINIENFFSDGSFKIERFNYKLNSWESIDSLLIKDKSFLNESSILALRIKGEGRLIIPGINVKGILK